MPALRRDLLAGLTTGILFLPQGLAYALLAGLPPISGLYAAAAGSLAYGLLGTSRQLSVGPVALDSMLTASALSALSLGTQSALVAHAALLAVMVGSVQLALGALRAGFVVNFLSRPVISGFTSGASLVIAISQLAELTGVPLARGSAFGTVRELLGRLAEVHLPTLGLGVSALVMLALVQRVTRRVPAPLVLLFVTALVAYAVDLGALGVSLIGEVPRGLPRPVLPLPSVDALRSLLPAALTIALVSYTESITTGMGFARKHRYEIAPNRELAALGAANLLSGLFAGYPVAGGLSRSAVHDRAGAESQRASVFSALVVLACVGLFTSFFRPLPRVVLGAVVLSAVLTLFDLATPRKLYRVKRSDFWLLVVTFAGTVLLGVSTGVAVGIIASLGWLVVRETRPHYALLGNIPGTQAWLNIARHPKAACYPGVLVVRMDAQLYFGNVSFLQSTLRRHEAGRSEPLRAVVLDASGVNQLDGSGLEALEELDRDYEARGVRLLLSRVKGPVRDVLERAGMLERLRKERRIFTRTHDAAECARLYVAGQTAPCQLEGGDLSAAAEDRGAR